MNIVTIRHNTNPELFLKIEDIEKIIDEYLNNFQKKYITTIEELIQEEMSSSGGLDEYAFCFNGNIPLRQKAQEVCTDISSLQMEIATLKEKIILAAKKHQLKEYKQLYLKIDEYLKELEEKKHQLKIKSEVKTSSKSQKEISIKNTKETTNNKYDKTMQNYQEEIVFYQKKKNIVEKEINEIEKRMR